MKTLTPENMTIAEKLSAMEILWDDLCHHNSIASPDWHKAVLVKREQQRQNGEQQAIGWEAAKHKIRQQIK